MTVRFKQRTDTLVENKVLINIEGPEGNCAGGKQVQDISILISGFSGIQFAVMQYSARL